MLWMKIKLHITLLLWTCGAFLLSNIFLFHKNFTSMIMANGNKRGGGHEMLARTIKYCERRLPRCAPDQTPTTGAPAPTPTPPALAPCLEFKQLFCFVEVASGCLFSFLSFYFLPFFRRHLKLQRLKGMADGWSNRHSAAQWTPAASRATAHREEAGPWMKRWVWVLWRARGEVRQGGLNMHSQICIWI